MFGANVSDILFQVWFILIYQSRDWKSIWGLSGQRQIKVHIVVVVVAAARCERTLFNTDRVEFLVKRRSFITHLTQFKQKTAKKFSQVRLCP